MIDTVQELDTLVDRAIRDYGDGPCFGMIEISIAANRWGPTMEVGLGPKLGFVHYLASDADCWTGGDASRTGRVVYSYMGSVSEIPASAEVPTEVVRERLHQFLATGQRPTGLVDVAPVRFTD